jgi:hypothetical protein
MVPFPKSHIHDVGFPKEISLKLTTIGGQPVTGVAVKFALSWAPAAVTCMDNAISIIILNHNLFTGIIESSEIQFSKKG